MCLRKQENQFITPDCKMSYIYQPFEELRVEFFIFVRINLCPTAFKVERSEPDRWGFNPIKYSRELTEYFSKNADVIFPPSSELDAFNASS